MAALGDLSDGSLLNIPMVDGSSQQWMVVNQGIPSSMYDASCDGTWLLMKDIYTERRWDNSDNDYKNSDIQSYLNSIFLNLLDENIRDSIKQVKIPYWDSTGDKGSVSYGTWGLSCKIFLLSGYEMGWTISNDSGFPRDGAKLSYFDSGASNAANNKRIAKYNGSATDWWLRSPWRGTTSVIYAVYTKGNFNRYPYYGDVGVRPAFIFPADLNAEQQPDGSYNIVDKKPIYLAAGVEIRAASPYIQAGSELVACDTTLS